MKRPVVTVALLGMVDPERRVVLSAITTLSAANALPAALDWTEPEDADVLVVDIDHGETVDAVDALTQARPRSLVRYSAQRGPQVDVSRPIRVQGLRDALTRAVDDTLARPLPAPADSPPALAGFRYRGVALLQRAGAAMTDTGAGSASGEQRYRGKPLAPESITASDATSLAVQEPAEVRRVYRGKAY